MDWQDYIIKDAEQIRNLLGQIKTVAVIGIRSEEYQDKAAYYVPEALQKAGLKIYPVSNYALPNQTILGEQVYLNLQDITAPIDVVNLFRKSADVPGHLDDIMIKKPLAVWLQLGISNNTAAEILAKSGIYVVQDRCLMVDYMRYMHGNSN